MILSYTAHQLLFNFPV